MHYTVERIFMFMHILTLFRANLLLHSVMQSIKFAYTRKRVSNIYMLGYKGFYRKDLSVIAETLIQIYVYNGLG